MTKTRRGGGKRHVLKLSEGMGMLLQSLRATPASSMHTTQDPTTTNTSSHNTTQEDPTTQHTTQLSPTTTTSSAVDEGEVPSTSAQPCGTSSQPLQEPHFQDEDEQARKIPKISPAPTNIPPRVEESQTVTPVALKSKEPWVEKLINNGRIVHLEFETKLELNLTSTPQLLGTWETEFNNNPLTTTPSPGLHTRNNFLKGCKWSPDGNCLLTNSEDRTLRVFSLSRDGDCGAGPEQHATPTTSTTTTTTTPTHLQHDTKHRNSLTLESSVKEGDLVYDFGWHPNLYSTDDAGFYACTARGQPVHLRNSITGETVASYRPYNHLDELSAAHSLAFSPDGKRLFLGFNKAIRIFDTARPGRQCTDVATTVRSLGGQSGLISCISVAPDNKTYVAGSYGRTVGLYSEGMKSVICSFQAHIGGVTHIKFSSTGTHVFSGGRKDPEIRCWDIRNLTDLLCVYQRNVSTNQRVYFDSDRDNQVLVSGCSGGRVRMWDLNKVPNNPSDWGQTVEPSLSFQAHESTVNGCSLNPKFAMLATGSGQRVFPCPLMGEGEGEEEEDYETRNTSQLDNSIKLWDLESLIE